ncbi:MAG: Hsp70 family protein [Deltaproteobacteria bacterium]|nr:Hsp70 family protein [Deltaproteobacteria bacterium]
MGAAIGIDLGTTNTVVAHCAGGQTAVLLDEQGANLLPSVVSFHPDGRTLVGREARKRRVIDAENTIFSVKRLIGRQWGTPEIDKARQIFSFQMEEGPKKQPVIVTRAGKLPFPAISALVVKRAKEIAEAALGVVVDRAVVTVPANFNDLQRSATRRAAKEAGLEVLRILNEPTAAALAYGLGTHAAEKLAVYDFGGGTFDLTLLEVSDDVVEVIATAGDSFLGGDDIDLAIEGQMVRAIIADHHLDPRTSVEVMALVRAAAEHLKIQLTKQELAHVELKSIGYGEGGVAIDFKYQLSRTQLERLAKPYVDRTLAVCADALRASKLDKSEFDGVILVGGSTRMPLVQERVESWFGRPPRIEWNPDEVVAVGAAVLAAMLTEKDARRPAPPPAAAARAEPRARTAAFALGGTEPMVPPAPKAPFFDMPGLPEPPPMLEQAPNRPHTEPPLPDGVAPMAPSVFPVAPTGDGPLLIDVTPLTLSVEIVGGYVDKVIPRNTAVPCTRTRRFATSVDQQRELMVRVCQGEEDRAGRNTSLGELVMSDLPPARRGDLWIEVSFALDGDGILHVSAKDEGTGREVKTQMRIGAEGG